MSAAETGTAPVLAVTPGEPAGIGPELVLRAAAGTRPARLLAVADPQLLEGTARALKLDLDIVAWSPGQPVPGGSTLACLPVPLASPAVPGQLNPGNARYVLDTLRAAVACVMDGHAQALVTGPVHKGVINDAGIPFTGHTEFLADLAGVERVVMMLAAGNLRVALVTTHLPLSAVPGAITRGAVEQTLRITLHGLREQFGVARPRVQVLGLNPHAGEDGHLGHEDREIIAPAIESCRDETGELEGPVPADTAFTRERLARCDAVLAMYHDQGLPVLKHAGFGRAINITLGLPFVRTSVDHGTALDLAGQGVADPGSLLEALSTAARLANA